MPCYKPLKGWYSKTRNPTGKRSIVFKRSEAHYDRPIQIPCGQCVGCRLERSRQWAIRCVHESSLYEQNCFITLTYNDENLNDKSTLVKADFQKFMKRLRKKFGDNIRFFHCGEYGEKNQRPHYHACIFNFDFPDKELWSIRNNVRLYRSQILQELWPFGFSTIGDVTFESAAYVARYIMKKINGDKAKEHYQGKLPEYTTMSRRPGIGKEWLNKFSSDVYPHDKVVLRNDVICKPPKYYDNQFELDNPEIMTKLKNIRKTTARLNPDNTEQRLAVRGKVKLEKIKNLRRTYEASNF